MKRILAALVLIASAAAPPSLYYVALQPGLGAYGLSVVLGPLAFALLCDQIILAAKPRVLVWALGRKGMARLHAVVPLGILAAALAHLSLKIKSGMWHLGAQSALAWAALGLIAILLAISLLYLGPNWARAAGPITKIRDALARRGRLNYGRARFAHAMAIIAVGALLAHAALASSSNLRAYPLGVGYMACHFALASLSYLAYRIGGRRSS